MIHPSDEEDFFNDRDDNDLPLMKADDLSEPLEVQVEESDNLLSAQIPDFEDIADLQGSKEE